MALNPSVKAELCSIQPSCLDLTEAELLVASTLQVRVQILYAAKPRIFQGAVFDPEWTFIRHHGGQIAVPMMTPNERVLWYFLTQTQPQTSDGVQV